MPKEQPAEEEGTTWGAARVLDVLEFLGRRTSPAPASIIASACHIPRSSTYGLLNLLKSRRFVAYRANERAWSLGSAAFELSAPCRYLWPIPVAAFVFYPYTKRFTALCHYVLGLTDGLAPAAAVMKPMP